MTEQQQWPAGQQSAVVITIDFNDIHGILTQTPAVAGRDKTLSVWRYGTLRGVDRLLALLDKHQIRASWCLPAVVAAENRAVFGRIVAAGHEIAVSGDRHQNFDLLTLEQQIASVRAGCQQLSEACGVRPVGFRTPAGQWKPGLAAALAAEGIRWSSSWRGDDLPYFHPGTRLVELPMHYELEDEPYFAFNLSPAVPPGQSRIASYRETLGNMQQDFTGFHRFGLCTVMRLHPEIVGTAGRIGMLDQLLSFMRGHQQVWFASAQEVAEWWQTQPDNCAEHPANVFARCSQEGHA